MDLEQELKVLIELAYQEDGETDVTSEVLCEESVEKEAVIIAKQSGVICGLRFTEQIVSACDQSVLVEPYLEEGDPLRERMMVVGLQGKIRSLLKIERVLLNFLSRLSGIATLTSQCVQAVEGTGAVILDTRKTVPGWRYLDKYAVLTGGAINHRMSLEDVALIKDTHVDYCGGLGEAIERYRKAGSKKPLIVEVRDMDELEQALDNAKVLTRIMLDNFRPELMRQAVERVSGRVLLEASGGITLANAREIAQTGVHFLSVGALTHSPKGFDFSFQLS